MNQPQKKIKILVISGGGIYGLIPSRFLQEITQDELEKVDVISGTSVGGILALYLLSHNNPKSLFYEFKSAINEIFATSFWRKINPFSSKYSEKGIEKSLKELLPNKVQDIKNHYFVAPSLGLKVEQPIIFHNFDESYSHIDLWKIGRATSAAPFYFPPYSENILIDGGVLENMPIITSASMSCKYLNIKISDIDMLVIGTGQMDVNKAKTKREVDKYSALQWANCLLPILTTGGNEMMSGLWGEYIGFNSFEMFNPVLVDGKMDSVSSVVSGALEEKCEIYVGEFKKVWKKFINY